MIIEIFLLALALLFLHHWLKRPSNLPPGPWTFPIVGSGFAFGLEKIKKYQQYYGNIFRLELGSKRIVYLCNYKLIKEALTKNEFSDRPYLSSLHFLTSGKEAGVIFSNGQRWSNVRRFLLRNLRDLGMGKSSLDDAIIQEAKFLVEDFQKVAGKAGTFPESMNVAVLNILWQMVASRRYEYDDKDLPGILKVLKALQANLRGLMILDMVPVLKTILPKFLKDKIFNMDIMERLRESALQLFSSTLEHRKKVLDPSYAENVIDEYLIQMQNKTDIAKYFDESDLMRVVFDLFGAGFDTTASTLRWLILYSAKYPEVQRRVQKQIDDVVPQGEFPSYHHKDQLPLVEALIHEVLRISSIFPMGVMISTNTDTHLAGYFIPKDTMIIWASGLCHQDPYLWDNPDEFRLERFLDADGRFVSQKEGFAPFGLGKRSCLGQSLSRMELFLFATSLLQKFSFAPVEGNTIDLTPDKFDIANFPKKQDFVTTVRR